MVSDEVIAAIADCEHSDAQRIVAKLFERVGRDTLRDAYIAATQEKQGGKDGPMFLQVAEFLRAVGDPPTMLVEDLLPANALVLITGKPKAGKSLMAIDLMDSIAEANPAFGYFTVNHPGPVCYLAMEDGQYEIANRLLERRRG